MPHIRFWNADEGDTLDFRILERRDALDYYLRIEDEEGEAVVGYGKAAIDAGILRLPLIPRKVYTVSLSILPEPGKRAWLRPDVVLRDKDYVKERDAAPIQSDGSVPEVWEIYVLEGDLS